MSVPIAATSSDAFIDDLVAHSEALFMSWHQQLREERDRRLKDLHSQNLQVAGRAFRRFEIYDDLLKREVKERIRIYKSVADEYECAELLSHSRLDALRDNIMTGVSWACLALKDRNDADFRAVGERSSPPEAGRYEAMKGRILGVVNAELAVLETEGRLRVRVSSKGVPETEVHFRAEPSGLRPSGPEPCMNDATASPPSATLSPCGPYEAANWENIEISFLSDQRLEIRVGKQLEVWNYAEMGMADRRTGNPNKAWGILLVLAQSRGELPDTARTGKDWVALEKRVERTRRAMQKHFGILGDPLPFEKGFGYRARFKITCAPSFDK